jgi:hypothetical protein
MCTRHNSSPFARLKGEGKQSLMLTLLAAGAVVRPIAGARSTGYGEIASYPRAIPSQSPLRFAKNLLNPKVTALEKQISSLSRRDATPSSTTGRNEIIDDRFWVSHDYQRLSSKIGRSGRLLALLGLPLSSNAEEWLRLRLLLRGEGRIARWR